MLFLLKIIIKEQIDYSESEFRYELEGRGRGDGYKENESLGAMGYSQQEFDEDSGEVVTVEETYEPDDNFELEDSYSDSDEE